MLGLIIKLIGNKFSILLSALASLIVVVTFSTGKVSFVEIKDSFVSYFSEEESTRFLVRSEISEDTPMITLDLYFESEPYTEEELVGYLDSLGIKGTRRDWLLGRYKPINIIGVSDGVHEFDLSLYSIEERNFIIENQNIIPSTAEMYLLPGAYQVSVFAEGYQPYFTIINIRESQDAGVLPINLRLAD